MDNTLKTIKKLIDDLEIAINLDNMRREALIGLEKVEAYYRELEKAEKEDKESNEH